MDSSIIKELHDKIAVLEKENRGLEDRCIDLEKHLEQLHNAAVEDRVRAAKKHDRTLRQLWLYQGKFHTLRLENNALRRAWEHLKKRFVARVEAERAAQTPEQRAAEARAAANVTAEALQS
jgi:hypothetical protein